MLKVKIIMADGSTIECTVPKFLSEQYSSQQIKAIELSDKQTVAYSMLPSEELLSEAERAEVEAMLIDIQGEENKVIDPRIVQRIYDLNAELKFALQEIRDNYKELSGLTIQDLNLVTIIPENNKLLRECISSLSNLEQLGIIHANLVQDTSQNILPLLLEQVAVHCQQLKMLSLANNGLFYTMLTWKENMLKHNNFLTILRFLFQHKKLQHIDLLGNSLLSVYIREQRAQKLKQALCTMLDLVLPQFIGIMSLCCPSLNSIGLLSEEDLKLFNFRLPGTFEPVATKDVLRVFKKVLSYFKVKSIKNLYQVDPALIDDKSEEAKFFKLVPYLLDLYSLRENSKILELICGEISGIFAYEMVLHKHLSGGQLNPLIKFNAELIKPLFMQMCRSSCFSDQSENKKSLISLAEQYDFAYQSMPDDGNCMFHALLHQLQSIGLCLDLNHISFRREIVKYIRDNIDDFRGFFAEQDQEHIEEHLRKMEQPATWGAEEIFAAVSKKFKVNAWVLNSRAGSDDVAGFKNPWLCYQSSDQAGNYDPSLPRIVVGFDASERHYYSLMPTKKLQARKEITCPSTSTSSSSDQSTARSSVVDVNSSSSSATATSLLPAFAASRSVTRSQPIAVLPPAIQSVIQDALQKVFICDVSNVLKLELPSRKRLETLLHIKFFILGALLELDLFGLDNLTKLGTTKVALLIPGITKEDLDKIFRVEFGFKVPKSKDREELLLISDKLEQEFYTKLVDLNQKISQFSKDGGDLTYVLSVNGVTIKLITETWPSNYSFYDKPNVGELVALDTEQGLDSAIAAGKLVLFEPKDTSYFREKIAARYERLGITSPICGFYWHQDNRVILHQQDSVTVYYSKLQSLVKEYANMLHKYFKNRERILEQLKDVSIRREDAKAPRFVPL